MVSLLPGSADCGLLQSCAAPVMYRRALGWIGTLTLLGMLLLPPTTQAQQPQQPQGAQPQQEGVTLNFKEADLSAVIATVSELTGQNFIVDPRVRGKVTVISSRPVDADEIYQVFLSLLNVHGFTVVPGPEASKIVPVVNAKQDAIVTATDRHPGQGDEYVTRVIQVENVAVSQLVPILRPLLPQQGHLAAYPPSNVLIASAEAANVERLVRIIQRIDLSGDEEVEIITLEHGSASEVVRILQALEKATEKDQPPAGRPTLVADERTNSILVSGAKNHRLRLRTIIAHLDTPLASGGNTEVVYLRYAKAEDLATVLTGVAESVATAANGAAAAPQAQAQARSGRGREAVTIQADANTNSLVITAAPDVMRSLKTVIRQLDIRRAQVLVEGVIAEISSSRSRELGVQWGYDGSGGNNPVGLINFSTSPVLGLLGANPLSAVGSGLNLVLGDTQNNGSRFGAFIRALSSDADTNILSTPSLVTMDNEEAEIVVGQNVPFVTGSYASTGGGTTPANPFQTIQRQDVGLTLRVRPQINEGNAVKLEVSQEVSSISPGTTGAADLITNKRSIKTSVIVDDGQLVVLGGLIDDDLQESVQKVPGLGDIPILGNLFSYSRTTKVKRNLMVFLHPVILRDEAQNLAVSGDKYNYLRARQLASREEGVKLMSRDVSPLLPELDELLVLPPPFEAAPSELTGSNERPF